MLINLRLTLIPLWTFVLVCDIWNIFTEHEWTAKLVKGKWHRFYVWVIRRWCLNSKWPHSYSRWELKDDEEDDEGQTSGGLMLMMNHIPSRRIRLKSVDEMIVSIKLRTLFVPLTSVRSS